MKEPSPLTLRCHAKVNLHLNVGLKRKDGFHEIETIFQEISLHDRLSFRVLNHEIFLQVTDKSLPQGPRNLVYQALDLLRGQMRIKKGMWVTIEKNIPIGAGLGGGSSDAAGALWAGWVLWGKRPKARVTRRHPIPSVLMRCARRLGADVPFFLRGGAAWAGGVGERCERLKTGERRWYILATPNIPISTKEAYASLDTWREVHKDTSLEGFYPRNSFEDPIFARYPLLLRIKTVLQRNEARPVLMSGSGSAVFGRVNNWSQGRAILKRLREEPWTTQLVHSWP